MAVGVMKSPMTDAAIFAQQDAPIFGTTVRLLKAAQQTETGLWKFGGIASSESMDEEGDSILRKTLDLTYLQKRGYVNWDHGRSPSDQIGFATKAEIIPAGQVEKYQDLLDVPLSKASSVYVEGVLYQHVKRAQEVHDILKSIPQGTEGALGLSVEGAMIKLDNGTVARAIVRGLAMSPAPAHPDTLCRLVKSLRSGVDTTVGHEPTRQARVDEPKLLTFNDALVLVQRTYPGISFQKAEGLVKTIFERLPRGASK